MGSTRLVGITGGSGFVGTHLIRKLVDRGFRVRALTRRPTLGVLPGIEEHVVGDLAEGNPDLSNILAGCDAVFHLAGRAHVQHERDADPETAYWQANVEATRQVAESCASARVQRVIFLSSVKVYGDGHRSEAIDSASPPAPSDAYGRTKLEAEEVLRRSGAEGGFEPIVFRPPLIYGPHVRANFLRLMRLVDSGIPLPFASLSNQRSFIYVGNLTDALIRAVDRAALGDRALLISDGTPVSTPQLVRELAEALDRKARLVRFPPRLLAFLAGAVGRADQVDRLTGSLHVDTSQSVERLGWLPRHRMAEGLRHTARWYRRQDE